MRLKPTGSRWAPKETAYKTPWGCWKRLGRWSDMGLTPPKVSKRSSSRQRDRRPSSQEAGRKESRSLHNRPHFGTSEFSGVTAALSPMQVAFVVNTCKLLTLKICNRNWEEQEIKILRKMSKNIWLYSIYQQALNSPHFKKWYMDILDYRDQSTSFLCQL